MMPPMNASTTNTVLEARGLITRAGRGPYDLTLRPGTITALTGPSGSGKSLLLRALADLDPGEGRVTLNDDARETVPAPVWRRRVAYLAAEAGWWDDRVIDHFPPDRLDEARVMATRLKLDVGLFDHSVARLSTGEKQRLALVRILLNDPVVLLLDEPTSALDAGSVGAVEGLIREKADNGTTVLLTTHDPKQAERLASQHLKIKPDGSGLEEVTP